MASVSATTTIKEYQSFVQDVYGFPNDRHFSLWDMLSNIERFVMRGLKGVRKNDVNKTKLNLLIAFSWLMSLMNRLHISIEQEVWNRFPYMCSYCGTTPCSCKERKIELRQKIVANESKRPKSLEEFQNMFEKIYPPETRTLEHAGVHLAEELGELSESIMTYMGGHKTEDFKKIELEAADFISCLMGVFNSLQIDVAKELSIMFSNNCHVCNKAPCMCSFDSVVAFRS